VIKSYKRIESVVFRDLRKKRPFEGIPVKKAAQITLRLVALGTGFCILLKTVCPTVGNIQDFCHDLLIIIG
jgi:hypothetical protein